jgi:hypothetical protein
MNIMPRQAHSARWRFVSLNETVSIGKQAPARTKSKIKVVPLEIIISITRTTLAVAMAGSTDLKGRLRVYRGHIGTFCVDIDC